jgi:hypothetical protein
MTEKLQFYDLKAKKKFSTADYKFVLKKGRRFAVTKAPSGAASWRIVGKAKVK